MKSWQLYLILVFFFCLLLLFQESFLNKFTIFGFSFNFCLIPVFLLIFFARKNLGLNCAILVGVILDLFSFFPFGVFTLSLILSTFLIERISQIFQKLNILVFLFLFGLFLAFYEIFLIFGNFIFSFL